jgi:hypothetical protein
MLLKPHHRTRSWEGFRETLRGLTALRDAAGETRALREGFPGWVSDSGKRDFGERGLAVGVGQVPVGRLIQQELRPTEGFMHDLS